MAHRQKSARSRRKSVQLKKLRKSSARPTKLVPVPQGAVTQGSVPQGFSALAIWRKMLAAQQRERQHILAATTRIKGLMPLLMKRRNGSRWSVAERAELHEQLRALGHLSPYLVVLTLPGSFVLLPVLAWWLDRRRIPRQAAASTAHEAVAKKTLHPFTDPNKDI